MTRQNPPRDERSLRRELAELQRRLGVLETAPRIGAWQTLTLNAGFTAALTGGLGFGYVPQYRFRSAREVELRGTIQKGTGAGGAGANGFANTDNPFTMPAEAWPAQTVYGPIKCSTVGGASSYGVVGGQMTNAGIFLYATGIANSPGWIALDGFRYEIT
ncbi:hypothetical protein [Actinomadura litoris]|uniref:hypothetical protein n=1 Tax=Actinomadura litoris TaxID=2678616 RepID=UPI001FA80662|nr:hypothetical protein [Actinomadura litoris]